MIIRSDVPFLLCLLGLAAAACHPLGLEGESCAKGPCAAGLTCVEEVCTLVEPPPPPPVPCEADEECVLDGTADGRVCTEGVCGYAGCVVDLQCGVRICDAGECADRHPCRGEDDCDDGQRCTDGVCRTPCAADDECAILGGVLQVCVDGECRQRCLGDFLCFGGICEENVCRDPECAVDGDCGEGDFYCDAGRCVAFTPCAEDDDCFDPAWRCNELGRCEERPLCSIDAECGTDRCVDRHCVPAVACAADDCADGLECVAGRCVEAPVCRGRADCSAGLVCDGGHCADEPAAVAPATVVVSTPQGPCPGACTLALFQGESVVVRAQGFDASGRPVPGPVPVTTSLDTDASGSLTTLNASAVGDFAVSFGNTTLDVRVRVRPAGALVIMAVDGGTGAPVAGAEVFVGTVASGSTDTDGLFVVPTLSPDEDSLAVRAADGRGVAFVGALADSPDRLRLPLPAAPALERAAGFRASVNGTGDELGDTGVSLALPAARAPWEAMTAALFGPAFTGSIDLPLFGVVPVDLPAALMLDGTVAVTGFQDIKPEAYVLAPPGPGALLAYEGRYEQQLLLNLAFSADPTELALDMAAQSEGMDALLGGAGLLSPSLLVIDGDAADGVEDVDGDGDVAELVPDYLSFPAVSLEPTASPSLRLGLQVTAPPEGANARAFAVCGVDAGLFLPLGLAALFGSPEGSRGEQLVAVAPPAALEGAAAHCVVHAVYSSESLQSFAQSAAPWGPLVELGELLAPPEGAFVLEDVPAPGRASVQIQEGATASAVRVRLFDGATTWDVIARGDSSVLLPTAVAPLFLFETSIAVTEGAPFAGYEGPSGALERVARAMATAR